MNIVQKALLRLAGVKSIATMVNTWEEGRPSYPEVSFHKLVKEGWRKNELIYACCRKKAATAAQVKLRVYDKRTRKPLDDHPLQAIIRAPNPHMSEYDLWYSVTVFQDFAGRAVYEIERDNGGRPYRFWPLQPNWIKPIPSRDKMIGAYEYTVPGMAPVIIPAEDILDFKLFDPTNRFHAWPPVAVAARVGDVDNSTTDFLKLFFEKGGTPVGILKTVQSLSPDAVTKIRAAWRQRYGGIKGWLEPAVLDRDATYQQIGLTFQEMGFEVLDARNEARICMIIGVPPIIIGAKVGLDRSTYSNYKEARASWWEDDLVPLYVDHLDTFQSQILREYPNDPIYLAWDFSEVPALREERLTLWQRANEGLRMGGILVNEYRAELGLDGVGPAGEVFLRPLNVIEVPLRVPVGSQWREIEGEAPKMLVTGTDGKANTPPDAKERMEREKRIGLIVTKALEDQKQRMIEEVEAEYARRHVVGE